MKKIILAIMVLILTILNIILFRNFYFDKQNGNKNYNIIFLS